MIGPVVAAPLLGGRAELRPAQEGGLRRLAVGVQPRPGLHGGRLQTARIRVADEPGVAPVAGEIAAVHGVQVERGLLVRQASGKEENARHGWRDDALQQAQRVVGHLRRD